MEDDSWANIDKFVHETETKNLNIIITILETLNYGIHNLHLIKLELLGDIFKEAKCCLSDIGTVVDCVFERSEIYDADKLLFDWRLQKCLLDKFLNMVGKEDVDTWIIDNLSK